MLASLTILGGGGWLPAHDRHTACALLREREHAILIDAGTGVARLVERPELLEGVNRLDIVLTHFHLDHIAGLAYLPAAVSCEQTTVWGPGQLLYGMPTAELIDGVSHEPFHPVPLQEQDIAVRDLPEGECEIGGTRVALRRQNRHSSPTLGLRFEDSLAWITDTAYDPETARFAAGCQLLAHEAWFTNAAKRNAGIHTSAAQAAQVAREMGSERLLLIHLPPFTASLEDLLTEASDGFPTADLAHDGTDLLLSTLVGGTS